MMTAATAPTTTRTPRRIGAESRKPAASRPKLWQDEAPRTLPNWAIKMRHDYESQISRLQDRVRELENAAIMTNRARQQPQENTALALYGESEEVKGLTKRLMYLLPNADRIGQAGVALVAQIAVAQGLDPLPGSDHVYAWSKGNNLVVTIGYRGLLHLARQQMQFTHQSRPMTDAEREEHGLLDGQIGYVTEVWVISDAARCKQLGIPYHPVVGTAVWSPGDNVPTARTGVWVAKKNSLKDALRQLVQTGVRMQNVLDAQFQREAMEWTVDLTGGESEEVDAQALIDAGVVPPSDDGPDVDTIDGEFTVDEPIPDAPAGQGDPPADPAPEPIPDAVPADPPTPAASKPKPAQEAPKPCSNCGIEAGQDTPVGWLCPTCAKRKADQQATADS